MDKNAIKSYAIWARRELIEKVTQRALLYGVAEGDVYDVNADIVNGNVLTPIEKEQRRALIEKIREHGYEQTMEEVAYTWFNRFAALRFMEVNGYLPTHIRVFTNDEGEFKPQIMTEAIHLELEGLDKSKVFELKDTNKDEELFKYLIITQCNALNSVLPGMFQRIADYTELLFPENLLRDGSVVEQMVNMIPEEDWTDQVQIIGWLYQYYNTEPKEKVFTDLKKNIKVTKEKIPAATQLFTPDWIVRYMVENSLGRLWIDGHPNDTLKARWIYYQDGAKQEPEVEAQLKAIREEHARLKPEDIKCIDPCMGSGHILCYMFDVLIQIYEAYGYTSREAVSSIVQNNLWGLDIDERASQLAYFAVMMKARQYDARFLNRDIQPHVYEILDSNCISNDIIEYVVKDDNELETVMDSVIENMHDAKEYGSIISTPNYNYDVLINKIHDLKQNIHMIKDETIDYLERITLVAKILSMKYDVVITNPPYMTLNNTSGNINVYIKKHYPISKNDLYGVFIERCASFITTNRYLAMITMHSWMFIGSFEKLRVSLNKRTLINMVHLGAHAFDEIGGEVVQTTTFIYLNSTLDRYNSIFNRLVEYGNQYDKEEAYLKRVNTYLSSKERLSVLPGLPIAYWVSDNVVDTFNHKTVGDFVALSYGVFTCNNARFLRFWFEVDFTNIDYKTSKPYPKWKLHNKGGVYRKWYGNQEYIIDYGKTGASIRQYRKSQGQSDALPGEAYYFKEHVSFSHVTTNGLSFRYYPKGMVFDIAAPSMFSISHSILLKILGLLNSKIGSYYLNIFNPTINNNNSDIQRIPFFNDVQGVDELVEQNVLLASLDWDSFETSWAFKKHPMIPNVQDNKIMHHKDNIMLVRGIRLSQLFNNWEQECNGRFSQLKKNEEMLNLIYINRYGLGNELNHYVNDEDITIYKCSKNTDIRNLVSYAVGCMFGRYSLDVDGLAYAGGQWDPTMYRTYIPDNDAIIPICDDEYFDDDIVGRFIQFIKVVYGEDTLEENLQFIADALDGKGTSREIIRNYFINDFFKDHCKTYQKRPIYWLFDSGKKNGFKCLIYMHRYKPDMLARIRTDYVHEQQARYRTIIDDIEKKMESASNSEQVKLKKQLDKVQGQATELHEYEEKIHHLADQMIDIDLDDGVKHNYALFQDVLAKIK